MKEIHLQDIYFSRDLLGIPLATKRGRKPVSRAFESNITWGYEDRYRAP